MNNLKDLFPETLLVDIADGHSFTTSRKVAEHFHKNHQHVIRDIKSVIADAAELGISLSNFGQSNEISLLESQGPHEISRPNFRPSTYKNSRGKKYPIYLLDRKAFSILAGRFKGKKALRWQIDFYDAFEVMETQLRAHTERQAAALHQLRPLLMPVVTATQQGLRRGVIGASINRSPASISYHRNTARRLGLLPQRKSA